MTSSLINVYFETPCFYLHTLSSLSYFYQCPHHYSGFPGGTSGKEPACQCRRCKFDALGQEDPWRRKWQPTPVFLPGKFHGQRSLGVYSPWSCRVRHDWATEYTYLNSTTICNTTSFFTWFVYCLFLNRCKLLQGKTLFVHCYVSNTQKNNKYKVAQ